MLAEDDTAIFTATAGIPYRVARGTEQGSDSIVARADADGSSRRRAAVRYASGRLGETLFGDAVSDGRYVFAVFAERPSWASFTVRDADELGPPEIESTCIRCGEDFATRYPQFCLECGEPRCTKPWCRACGCEPPEAPRRTCDACFVSKLLSRFDGDATTCRDCLGE